MALFAISDLHLSLGTDKPMDLFGENWINHADKIKVNWLGTISKYDTVLIPGDISWAMRQQEANEDLEFIKSLPGNKIFVKGNHDLWWDKTKQLNDKYDNMHFIHNCSYSYKDIAVVGTRGWSCPNDIEFTQKDMKIYIREQQRLIMSIEHAIKNKFNRFIVMLHYPPTNDKLQRSAFIEIVESYPVEKVIYGHLHGIESYEAGLQGFHNGVEYRLASCDYLNFKPIKLI